MILQALNDYYRRKQAADPDALAPDGFEFKEIPFVIVLNPDGSVHDIRDTRSGEGRARRAKRYTVPKAVKRTVGIAANLLWDNAEYTLSLACEGRGTTQEDLARRLACFIERIDTALPDCEDDGLKALRAFLHHMDHSSLAVFPAWPEIQASNPNLSFQLIGDTGLIAERPALVERLRSQPLEPATDEKPILCLVTGERDQLARLHDAIKGVWNANTSGANIVSFNLPAFNSHGKSQGGNAPIGRKAAANYAAALNTLLGKDSTQRAQLGDASTVFWASVSDTPVEAAFAFLASSRSDDPDAGTHAVRGLFSAIRNGAYIREDGNERFHVLGLAPNAARLSVRFWHTAPIHDFATHIAAWFEDSRIALPAFEHREFLPLGELLRSLAVLGESKNIPPNLAGDTLRAILEGRQLPAALLQQAVIRCRAERKVTPARASLIKACLTRQARLSHQPEHGATMSLDTQDTRPAYRLGRLFAALEKIQGDANPGLNATIRERYYGAASASPATVFPILLRLKNHHLAKLEGGMKIHRERLLGEIVNGIAQFSPQLSLADQGLFAIGYYHQMQDFYTRKPSEPTDRTEESQV